MTRTIRNIAIVGGTVFERYIGTWYLAFFAVCATSPEEGDGLLTYTVNEFIGSENRCRIVRAAGRRDRARDEVHGRRASQQ